MVNLPGLVAMFVLVIAACSSIRKKPPLLTGDICTIDEGNGTFGVVKILLMESDRVHVKMYSNKFYTRPEMIDPTSLSMGEFDEVEIATGIPHLPYEKLDFNSLKPEVEANEIVLPEELAAYWVWKRQL